MNYENYIKQPMQKVKFKLDMLLIKTPYLINLPSRSVTQPIFTKMFVFQIVNIKCLHAFFQRTVLVHNQQLILQRSRAVR